MQIQTVFLSGGVGSEVRILPLSPETQEAGVFDGQHRGMLADAVQSPGHVRAKQLLRSDFCIVEKAIRPLRFGHAFTVARYSRASIRHEAINDQLSPLVQPRIAQIKSFEVLVEIAHP